MATVTDTSVALFADQTINNDAIAWSVEEIDRGEDTIADIATVLVRVTGWAATTDAGGYLRILVAPLDGTGGTLHDDLVGMPITPVSELGTTAGIDAAVQVMLPQGCRYVKVGVENKSGQNTAANAASADLLYQAVTL